MEGGGGDPFDFCCPFDGFGGSGVPNNGSPSLIGGDYFDGFGGPNNEPPSLISNVFRADSIDRFDGVSPSRMSNILGDSVDGGGSFGGSNNGPQGLIMSNILRGDAVDGFGGLSGGPPSLMSNFLGGRDQFDDPFFFTQPFGGSMFQPNLFGPPTKNTLAEMCPYPLGFLENHHHQPPQPRLSGGPIIEEIFVLDDDEEGEVFQEKRVILGKHGRSSSEVETEEAIAEERKITHMQNMNANAMVNNRQQQTKERRRITHIENMKANAMVENEQWQQHTQERKISHMQIMHDNPVVNNEQWHQQIQERRIRHMQNMNANAMVDNEQWQPQTQERRITHMHNMNANAMVHNGQWQPQTQDGNVNNEQWQSQERRFTHMQNMNASDIVNNEQWQPQERRIRHMHNMHANTMMNSEQWQPQTQGYSFQSSSVTYGGHKGNYYTSSTTRRTGSDGLTFEESKEANTATREAAHRISRGFHNKGHTVERTLNSDGRVGTNQILHNLNEDELDGFEQSWSSNAGMQMQFPRLSGSFGSGFVNREQPLMLLPPTHPSPSRARGEHYRR